MLAHDENAPVGAAASATSQQRLARMFAALSATNEAILRTTSADALYQQACAAALTGGGLLGAAVLLREPQCDRLAFVAGAGDGIERLRHVEISVSGAVPTGRGMAGEAFRSGRPCVSNDFLNDVRGSAWREELDRSGVRAAAAVPLIRGGQSVGVLLVFFGEVGACDDEIVALLVRMVENLAFALDNLDRAAERRASARATGRLTRMYAALSATNEAILRSKSPQELYQRVCDAAVHGGKSVATSVLLAEPGSHWLNAVAGTGEIFKLQSKTRFSVDPASAYGRGVAGQAFRNQRPAVNPDILNSDQGRPWHDASLASGAVACVAVPLVARGRSIGVLMFFVGRSWAADEEIVSLLARIGENVSFALENFEREDERARAEARAQHLATHDDLTGLPNRAMFSQLLNDAIAAARRAQRTFAVLFVDLDRFKLINDTLGHAAGDALLNGVAGLFRQCLRERDVLARFGGDEFVILLDGVADIGQVSTVARKLLSAAVTPMMIQGRECRVTASIGIALFPDHGADEQALTKNADAAMYLAKEEGRSSFRFFSKEIKTQSIERLMLETSLRRALERHEFLLHYQAKQSLDSAEIAGVEALLRWQHPDLGMVPPLQFIPIAEESGLIVPIGRWVVETACAQAVAWQAQGLPPMRMAVNLSPRQFADANLLADIRAALRKTGLEPHLLELEITESMVMQSPQQAKLLLAALKKLGVHLSIDDFGTGYSSMSLIKEFPIDTLKVDRSFVRDVPFDANDCAITKTVIALAKALDLTVIAEGVETKAQESFLREQDCDQIQGFLFSKPLAGDEFATFAREHNLGLLKEQAAKGRSKGQNNGQNALAEPRRPRRAVRARRPSRS
jgi:diguanylate cyclase (GGDEF)-like protein